MRYLTGTYALNIPCRLETDGDWHAPALNWAKPRMRESSESVFGEWGIERVPLPNYGNMTAPVADHLRACLDLIEGGYFGSAQGMRKNFINNEAYTAQIFDKVTLLADRPSWNEIDAFLGKEYGCAWLSYRRANLGY